MTNTPPSRPLAYVLAVGMVALGLAAATPASADAPTDSDNEICVENDPVSVAGRQILPATRYCIPAP